MSRFIKLTYLADTFWVSVDKIAAFRANDTGSTVLVIGSESLVFVRESPSEILDLINLTENEDRKNELN